MKNLLLFIVILFLICPVVYGAPVSSMSIIPSAVDATTITASDENTRNNSIATTFNAHDHNDIDQAGNTVSLGDGTAGNKTIEANNADASKPYVRFDDTNNRWVLSRDGSAVETIVSITGATIGDFLYDPDGLKDDDGNTLVQVEESANDDIVRIDTNGVERWKMSKEGEMTMVTQPAFLGAKAADQDNLTADSAITITFGTEIFDQSGDFASSTFTAPVDGRYMLSARINFINMDTAATSYEMRIVTSNRSYTVTMDPRQFAADVAGKWGVSNSVLADMDASDTAVVHFFQTAGTAQTDVQGATENVFSGFLAL